MDRFTVFVYIFGYAAIYKVFQLPNMMQGIIAMGFGKNATLIIGWAELVGAAGLLASIFYPSIKPIAVLWLWRFAIGALAVHFSYHHSFYEYRNALLVTITPLVLLTTDQHFYIRIG